MKWLSGQTLAPLRRLSLGFFRSAAHVDDLLTPFPEVIEELKRRSADKELRRKVEEYLGGDIPPYFTKGPVLYLARHVATPNYETLRFIHLVETCGMKVVIGQDTKDKFVPHNQLKKALGKLPVCLGITNKEGVSQERYQKIRVIDFNSANGRQLGRIQTLWGQSLVDFHAELLAPYTKGVVEVHEDAEWIDRNHRGDLLEHYKKFLALFVVHGVLFEDYQVEDKHEGRFVNEVLRPAYRFVEEAFGYRPLITQLTPTSVEHPEYWISYPKEVLDIVRKKLISEV